MSKGKVVKVRMLKATEKCKVKDEVYMNHTDALDYIKEGIVEIIEEQKEETKKQTKNIKKMAKTEKKKEIKTDEPLAKQILDKWGTVIVPKEAIYESKGVAGINQEKCLHYEEHGFKEDFMLWIAPKDCIRIEFEDVPDHNHRYIVELESVAKSLGYDYCVTGHGGKSDYFNMFNIKHLPLNDDNKNAKMLLIDELIGSRAKDQLDRTNLGWTLSPIIDMPHWKPKYNEAIHRIIRGKNPLEHKNTYPKYLLTKLRKAKEWHSKNEGKWKFNNNWVEDFLINFCCNNHLPEGSRHFIIEKNLCALIIFRKDKEEIKARYYKTQERTHDSLRTWERSILNGEYTEVSPGELAKFIKEHKLDYKIPKPKKIEKNGIEIHEDAFKTLIITLYAQQKKAQASELIVKNIYKTKTIYTTRDDEHSEMWIYEDGIYVENAKTRIQEHVRKIMGDLYTTTFCNLVIDKIKSDTYIKQEDFFKEEKPHLIAVKNGILNLKTKELKNFDRKYFFFNKMPIKYDPTKKCPNILKFFDSLFKDKDEINIIQEIFGFLPYREYFLEKSLMFLGNGRNGKGKTMELMQLFLAIENCGEISLESMEEDIFSVGELFKKQANLCGDLSKTSLKNTGSFKKLTGRDLIMAPRKFKTRVSFRNYAKMIFSANELPRTHDISLGFWSRWIILDFPYTFLTKEEINNIKNDEEKEFVKERDPNIIEKITNDDEFSGLLNWALEGLQRLLKNKSFSHSPSTKETETKWLRKSSSFNAFCMDSLDEEYNCVISKLELKGAYVEYCRNHKINILGDKVIKAILSETFGCCDDRVSIDGNQVHSWIGIRFKKHLEEYYISQDSQGSHSISTYRKKTKKCIGGKQGTTLTTLSNVITQTEDIEDQLEKHTIHQPCSICGTKISHTFNKKGNPLCETCYKAQSVQK